VTAVKKSRKHFPTQRRSPLVCVYLRWSIAFLAGLQQDVEQDVLAVGGQANNYAQAPVAMEVDMGSGGGSGNGNIRTSMISTSAHQSSSSSSSSSLSSRHRRQESMLTNSADLLPDQLSVTTSSFPGSAN